MSFLDQHPLLLLLVWPALTALVTSLFAVMGHMSADDYAKLPPPVATFLQLLASSGLDAPKVMKLLAAFLPKGPMAMFFLLPFVSILACGATLKAVEAEGTYGMQLMACVDKYSTRPSIDLCRSRVDEKWGRLDAGCDGACQVSAPKVVLVDAAVDSGAPDGDGACQVSAPKVDAAVDSGAPDGDGACQVSAPKVVLVDAAVDSGAPDGGAL